MRMTRRSFLTHPIRELRENMDNAATWLHKAGRGARDTRTTESGDAFEKIPGFATVTRGTDLGAATASARRDWNE